MIDDLNRLHPTGEGAQGQLLEDCSIQSQDGRIAVYFRNLDQHVIQEIAEADIVLGCVAWLTNFPILEALTVKRNVSIIVQKEDFLRHDVPGHEQWKTRLRGLYDSLSCELEHHMFGDNLLSSVSISTVHGMDPVRCVGNHNRDRPKAFPRMHNKFLVFCRERSHAELLVSKPDGYTYIVPYAVWTGSFNFTTTATLSLENALVINEKNTVRAYYREYGQIAALSERLDWAREWAAPEWQIEG